MRCQVDKLMYLSPQPGEKYCEILYNHPTYFQGIDDMYGLLINDEKTTAIASIRLKEIRQYAPQATSLLEIGCARGHLLQEALHQGFSVVKGIEFSKEAVRVCRDKKLDVKYENINKLIVGKNFKQYDIVAAYSILEHLNNPFGFLKMIKKFIKPAGLLIIRVPETSPVKSPNLSLLDHFWHFTRTSAKRILNKTGFKIKDIYASGVFHGIQHKSEVKNITIIAA